MKNRKEILDLLAKGKITADEAADMLGHISTETTETLSDSEPMVETNSYKEKPAVKSEKTGSQPSWFRVRVRNLETGQNKVTVNIPLRMLNFGLQLGRRFAPELDDLDYDKLTGLMNEMGSGMLVEVQDEEDNEHIQVFVE
jgi:hypothetical protein